MGIFFIIILILLMVLVVGVIVFSKRAAKDGSPCSTRNGWSGRKMYGGQSAHLPLKVNSAEVIPPIFASSIIMFPATIANFIPHPWMKSVANDDSGGGSVMNCSMWPSSFLLKSYSILR